MDFECFHKINFESLIHCNFNTTGGSTHCIAWLILSAVCQLEKKISGFWLCNSLFSFIYKVNNKLNIGVIKVWGRGEVAVACWFLYNFKCHLHWDTMTAKPAVDFFQTVFILLYILRLEPVHPIKTEIKTENQSTEIYIYNSITRNICRLLC